MSAQRRSGRALIAQVSALYYLDGRTQEEIAVRLQLSHAKVSRLLRAARETGVVRIFVRPPPGVLLTLETELEERFGLREVRIVPASCDESADEVRRKIGRLAAADLARTARPGHAVGLVGVQLLAAMVDVLPPKVAPGIRVVQGVGWKNASSPQRSLTDLVFDLARRIEGSPVVLPAPSVVESERVRHSLAAEPRISDSLRALDTLDTLYAEIAPAAPNVDRTRDEPIPVGHIALRHFDRWGVMLGAAVDGHVVGLTLQQLYRTRHVVALAHDPAQAHVIAAALRTRLVGTLITDELTARAIAALLASRADRPIAGARMTTSPPTHSTREPR